MKTQPSQNDRSKNSNSILKYIGFGSQVIAFLAVGVWGGMKLDELTGWPIPVFLISLPLLGVGYCLYKLIVDLNRKK